MTNVRFNAVIDFAESIERQVASSLGSYSRLYQQIGGLKQELVNLSYEFRDYHNYELFVNAFGTTDRNYEIQLSDNVAQLVLSGQAKYARDRTKQETAAMVLVAAEAEEICDAELGYCPDLTPKNISIGEIIPYE